MKAIVNISPGWGIGKEGQLLVHIHADMRRFRALTLHHTIICGRKTLESFPNGEPLPNRRNIVLTQNPSYRKEGVTVCHSLLELQTALAEGNTDDVFVCGGEQIYRLLLPYCDEALVTLNYLTEGADRFFPNLNRLLNWHLTDVGEKQWEADLAFRYLTFKNDAPLTFIYESDHPRANA